MLIARQYRITGRVQGVGFRFFSEEAARREGLSGWVRNCPDRSVEVFAEGDAEAVVRFEATIRRGPPGARVDAVQVTDEVPIGRNVGFAVR
jgi:acylphosphatase